MSRQCNRCNGSGRIPDELKITMGVLSLGATILGEALLNAATGEDDPDGGTVIERRCPDCDGTGRRE